MVCPFSVDGVHASFREGISADLFWHSVRRSDGHVPAAGYVASFGWDLRGIHFFRAVHDLFQREEPEAAKTKPNLRSATVQTAATLKICEA